MTLESTFRELAKYLSGKFRERRTRRFLLMFPPEKVSPVIDIGGLVDSWSDDPRDITVLNLMDQAAGHCKVLVGDGRHTRLADKSFALAYSNSALEHVGEWTDQVAFATELSRVGQGIYCQTPNRWFPFEVHYYCFFWHWYPRLLNSFFVVRFLTGWGWLVRPDRQRVREYANSVRLLSFSQMRKLFPDCEIHREKFLGLTKSLIAVRGNAAKSDRKAIKDVDANISLSAQRVFEKHSPPL
jgi:hypothetical protein